MKIEEMRKDVRYWQRMLRLAGFYKGNIDGKRGRQTEAAEEAWAAAVAAVARDYGRMDERSEGNVETLVPEAQRIARQWWRVANEVLVAYGRCAKIICGTRTYAEQDALYAQGRTKRGARVTNARGGYSWHNFGLAFDFGVFTADGKGYIGEGREYDEVGVLARDIAGAEWGGDWRTFKDKPHIQMRVWGSVAEARAKF